MHEILVKLINDIRLIRYRKDKAAKRGIVYERKLKN